MTIRASSRYLHLRSAKVRRILELSTDNKTARKRPTIMTRKHFELIAYHVSNLQYDGFTADQIEKVAREIANACAVSNPRFNRAKFVEACTK